MGHLSFTTPVLTCRHAEDAQRNGKKISTALENDKDRLIKDTELNVDAMLDEVEKDVYALQITAAAS